MHYLDKIPQNIKQTLRTTPFCKKLIRNIITDVGIKGVKLELFICIIQYMTFGFGGECVWVDHAELEPGSQKLSLVTGVSKPGQALVDGAPRTLGFTSKT